MKYRLSETFINKLKKLPESGMGYQNVKISYDGNKILHTTVTNCEYFETEVRINNVENIELE